VARENKEKGRFVRVLGEKLAGFPNGIVTPKPGRSTIRFGESGFKTKFVDSDGHPARHFTANLVLSFQGSRSLSSAIAVLREIPGFDRIGGCIKTACSIEDIRLGAMGAEAGELLWKGGVAPEDMGQWIRDNL